MGTITISVDDDLEERFRAAVQERLGKGKGILGQAVQEAMNSWVSEKDEEEIAKRQLALLKKGYSFGRWKFNREELHERAN